MRITATITAIISLIGAPLLGIYLSGEPIKEYLAFPPATTLLTMEHPSFSWFAFFLLILLIALTVIPFLIRIFTTETSGSKTVSSSNNFPVWGWTGLIIMAAGWILAWTRFQWFSQFQTHTFTIPWIGFIIILNALTFKRSGRSLITHEPLYFACLFIFSAVFWWYFEFLNQFVENWYYVNIETLGRFEFFLYATLPFSTVLPAVLSTRDLLKTFPGLSRGLDHFVIIAVKHQRTTAVYALSAASATLSLTALLPAYLFPMLWIAPLVIIASAMVIAGVPTVLDGISRGDWNNVYLLALSALICGFFWEMWNYFSYTQWEYAVPFVGRFKIFEMPVLGYAGYLPFGLQCGLMAGIVRQALNSRIK